MKKMRHLLVFLVSLAFAVSSPIYITKVTNDLHILPSLFSCLSQSSDIETLKWVIIVPKIEGIPFFRNYYHWITEVGEDFLQPFESEVYELSYLSNIPRFQALKELNHTDKHLPCVHFRERKNVKLSGQTISDSITVYAEPIIDSYTNNPTSISSLQAYRKVYDTMVDYRQTLPNSVLMSRREVSFHEHVHVLYDLRSHLPHKLFSKVAIYLEIGVWKGATSILMATHPLQTEVYGVDSFDFSNQMAEASEYVKYFNVSNKVHWVKGRSGSVHSEVLRLLGSKKIDILFIDGDHSQRGATTDFQMYAPLVNPGGFVVFDDYMDAKSSPEVFRAVNDLVATGNIRLEYIIHGTFGNVHHAQFSRHQGASELQTVDAFVSNEFVLQKKL